METLQSGKFFTAQILTVFTAFEAIWLTADKKNNWLKLVTRHNFLNNLCSIGL